MQATSPNLVVDRISGKSFQPLSPILSGRGSASQCFVSEFFCNSWCLLKGVHQADFDDSAACAQAAQTQALSRACCGMAASSALPKLASVHQQGGCFTPVARSTSMAHWLAWPHSGQTVGSVAGMTGMDGLRGRKCGHPQSVEGAPKQSIADDWISPVAT